MPLYIAYVWSEARLPEISLVQDQIFVTDFGLGASLVLHFGLRPLWCHCIQH